MAHFKIILDVVHRFLEATCKFGQRSALIPISNPSPNSNSSSVDKRLQDPASVDKRLQEPASGDEPLQNHRPKRSSRGFQSMPPVVRPKKACQSVPPRIRLCQTETPNLNKNGEWSVFGRMRGASFMAVGNQRMGIRLTLKKNQRTSLRAVTP